MSLGGTRLEFSLLKIREVYYIYHIVTVCKVNKLQVKFLNIYTFIMYINTFESFYGVMNHCSWKSNMTDLKKS